MVSKMNKVVLFLIISFVSLNGYTDQIVKDCSNSDVCTFKVGDDFEFLVAGIGSILPLSQNLSKGNSYQAINDVTTGCVRVIKGSGDSNTIGFFSTRTGEIFPATEGEDPCR